MVTHDKDLAEYADRIIHIFDGRIEEIVDLKKEKAIEQEELEPDQELSDAYIEDGVIPAENPG